MKTSDKPQLSKKWWMSSKPGEIKGADLERALANAEKALLEQQRKGDPAAIDTALAALGALNSAVSKTIKNECDKKKHKELITVMEKYDGLIEAETKGLEKAKGALSDGPSSGEEEEEDENKLFDKEYLYKMIKLMKSGGT